MRRIIPLLIVGGLIITACGGSNVSANGPLVIYSGRSEELIQPLIDQFAEESGLKVEVRYGGSTELAATLIAEGGSSDADVFFSQDPASLGSVTDILSVLPDSILEKVDPKFRDREGRWVGTSGRVRTFVYNTSAGLPLPQTIDDVTDPVWAGQLGIAPTNGSFLAFVSAMILERGETATLDFLKRLAANHPVDYPKNSPIVAAADKGEIAGGLVNHYYLLELQAEGGGHNAANWFIPAGDVGTLLMPSGVGIVDGTDQPEAARQFVEFLLGRQAQQYFTGDEYEYPLSAGVPPAAGVTPLDQINTPNIDLSELAGVLATATRLVAEAGLV